MNVIPLDSLASAHLTHLNWSDSESLRRLIQLAYRNGARAVVALDAPECPQWSQESNAMFGDIADLLGATPPLLLFVKGDVKGESDIRKAGTKGDVVGYAILRPSPLGSVVEGFIVPSSTSDIHYITCQSEITIDVPGTNEPLQLSLKGLPFMQQDGVVSRCADASIWIATSLVAGAHPEWHDCSIITRRLVAEALQYSPEIHSRRLPSGGLGFHELMLVLERQGYDPILYSFVSEEDKKKSDHIVYRWVESGIPVILGLELEHGLHTVVVCGHTFDPDAWWPGARTDYFPRLASEDRWLSSSLWAVQYLVLDDNFGPALAMTRGSLRTRSYGAIVPVPKDAKVYLLPEEAETVAANLIFVFGSAGGLAPPPAGEAQPWLDWLFRATTLPTERFVIRTLLARGTDVQEHLQAVGYPASVAKAAKSANFPDSVWLCEVSLPEIYGDKLKVGELVLDARLPAGMHKQGFESLRWMNLVGQVLTPGTTAQYAGFTHPVGLFDTWLGK